MKIFLSLKKIQVFLVVYIIKNWIDLNESK
jgi:hypothetical protein